MISQGGKPIAFYSRKWKVSKTKYTVTEKELLSILNILKVFHTNLLGQKLKLYTEHKNLTCKNFNNDRVLWWKLILEQYSLDIEYIPGAENIVADALSQFPNNGNQETAHESTYTAETMSYLYDIEDLIEGTFTISFKIIDRHQQEDPFLKEKLNAKNIPRVLFAEAVIL